MNKYSGKITGEFEEIQHVEANSMEEAIEKLSHNLGETMDRTAIGHLTVTGVSEIE